MAGRGHCGYGARTLSMNTYVSLLMLLVTMRLAAGRSALGVALDLVDEFQAMEVPGFGTTSFGQAEATKMIEDVRFILATSRKGFEEKAGKEQTAIDPHTLRNLDLMEHLLPRAIRIVADMTSDAEADPSLEPVLSDLTGHVAGTLAAPAATVGSGLPAGLPAPTSGTVQYVSPAGGYYYVTRY